MSSCACGRPLIKNKCHTCLFQCPTCKTGFKENLDDEECFDCTFRCKACGNYSQGNLVPTELGFCIPCIKKTWPTYFNNPFEFTTKS